MCVWAYLLRHVSLYKIQSIDQANQGLLSSYQLLIFSFSVFETDLYGVQNCGIRYTSKWQFGGNNDKL